ncbi:SDR family NAD(P)-dependent oxidoreductase [Streptomyces sp. CA-210063]|uniref:SDR family NAD(P)-dependent oxidoreductase n=1 Tax=Streptomyces sp. CA-210063 TaxID=2801029 RepID=UPI00214AAEAF|nr:SDR family NAD(P)-dependent oxidoreductase [Streptomyces sp. CA-210063]UUU30289.1 SDR family NAD(P)-dependent oxidoreductase [Streptomyces sp. CA-210063]
MTVSSAGFTGKVAAVTGAGSGIGRTTTAVVFARAGARVALADLSPDGPRKTARLIEEAGGQALALARSDAASLATGHALVVDGGRSV